MRGSAYKPYLLRQMNLSTAVWLSLASVFLYMSFIDPNVPLFLVLWGKRIRWTFARVFYTVSIHPETPWMRYRVWKNGEDSARAIAQELGLDKNKDWYDS